MKHYKINEIKTNLDVDKSQLPEIISKKLRISVADILKWEVRKLSIDSRHKPDIKFVYSVDFWSEKDIKSKDITIVDDNAEVLPEPKMGSEKLIGRPVVVGMGPCGIFAALTLAKCGYKPLVIDRGPKMNDRVEAVETFRTAHILNPDANMLFGEGGAGTFSDGKLTTGIKDPAIRTVLKTFADAGAGEEITYLAKPHIGTDVLRKVIVNLRNQIIELGGEVRFNTKLEKLNIQNGELVSIETSAGTIETNALILAIGHSARDTFAMINDLGLNMEQKNFSIGVRMEHPQELIDKAQYGEEALAKYRDLLPPADYKLSYKASNDRGVYSFCMCPGGEVVVCTTEPGEICVNGMSNRKRDSGTANSGILCDVRKSDYNNGDESDVLAGVRFQEKYERLAFENGGGNYEPPRSKMGDFLDGNAPQISASLPEFATVAITEAVPNFARKISGFDSRDAIVTAVETRSSSPVRILRGSTGESNIAGIYPAGEGAGYAGGITSASCDGIKIATRLIEKFAKK